MFPLFFPFPFLRHFSSFYFSNFACFLFPFLIQFYFSISFVLLFNSFSLLSFFFLFFYSSLPRLFHFLLYLLHARLTSELLFPPPSLFHSLRIFACSLSIIFYLFFFPNVFYLFSLPSLKLLSLFSFFASLSQSMLLSIHCFFQVFFCFAFVTTTTTLIVIFNFSFLYVYLLLIYCLGPVIPC